MKIASISDRLRSAQAIPWLGLCWVLLSAVAVVFEFYPLLLLPFVVGVGYLLIYRTGIALIFIGFATPLSYQIENAKALGGIGISLPVEILLVSLMALYIVKLIMGHRENARLIRHPLTMAVYVLLGVVVLTTLTSSMPVVSLKFLLSRLWFILCMYFLINQFFADRRYMRRFVVCSVIGMSVVVVYTISRHFSYQFSERAALFVMEPFFKDHTIYGALLALTFPFVILEFNFSKALSFRKIIFAGLILLFTVALVFSYTRAAWLSLVGAFGVWLLMFLRIKFSVVLVSAVALLGTLFLFQDTIAHRLEKNRQDSSSNLTEHVQSMSNISSDASNLERLNRWNSALRMWGQKPLFGYGPGTYAFQYGTFQKSSDRTIISTNQGDGGNAHSEYLGPLAEQGILGLFAILLLVGTTFTVGIKLYFKLERKSYERALTLTIVLSLVTYFLHGALNNYLDTEKASVPIWAMLSMLVAIDIYYPKTIRSEQLTAK